MLKRFRRWLRKVYGSDSVGFCWWCETWRSGHSCTECGAILQPIDECNVSRR